jgi:hypothetical protein
MIGSHGSRNDEWHESIPVIKTTSASGRTVWRQIFDHSTENNRWNQHAALNDEEQDGSGELESTTPPVPPATTTAAAAEAPRRLSSKTMATTSMTTPMTTTITTTTVRPLADDRDGIGRTTSPTVPWKSTTATLFDWRRMNDTAHYFFPR